MQHAVKPGHNIEQSYVITLPLDAEVPRVPSRRWEEKKDLAQPYAKVGEKN